jgi:hypothetical protein
VPVALLPGMIVRGFGTMVYVAAGQASKGSVWPSTETSIACIGQAQAASLITLMLSCDDPLATLWPSSLRLNVLGAMSMQRP